MNLDRGLSAPLAALLAAAWGALACTPPAPIDSGAVAEWPYYGGDAGGQRYSPLDQIHPGNVNDLEVAWTYHHGDVFSGDDETTQTSFNATPIVADGGLYFCTGTNRVIALDPESGDERWTFDPHNRLVKLPGPYTRSCRGVSYWRDPRNTGGACRRRIFTGTLDSQLIALDAETGLPCSDFGTAGRVELREGVGEAPPWEYYVTSPPLVIHDLVVIGALISDNLRTDAPGGVVRAYDARSGALRWAWDPVPPDSTAPEPEPGGYVAGTANVWSIISGDAERNLVFIPTGNAAPDYYRANRNGLDGYASSTIALDASTGQLVWQFQTVHGDVWDYDVASQPALFELAGPQGPIPAVAQATKMGHLFLLNRDTGKPLFRVDERPVPPSTIPGETLSPTQPFPTHPPPLHPASLTPDDAWGFTPWDRARCAEIIAGYRSEGIFTPPSFEGSIAYPGSAGGANWGSVSIDPKAGVLYVNQTRAAMVVTLTPREEARDTPPSSLFDERYPMAGTPYVVRREPLLSPLGAPCNPPPWGTLTAVDLQSGEVLWESTLGTTRDQAPWPLWLNLGTPNLGGSIVTAGGLVFIGATTDKFLRGFDARTGEEIWTQRLPFTANATPISYRLKPSGRQYVVIAAGGHGWSEAGDALIAFALP